VEGNRVGGAVTIDNSAVDFKANSVGGRLACVNGGALAGGGPHDASLPPNSVRGTSTC
jgi:hypothetical protein